MCLRRGGGTHHTTGGQDVHRRALTDCDQPHDLQNAASFDNPDERIWNAWWGTNDAPESLRVRQSNAHIRFASNKR
jgi:hypothetical protein